MWLGGGNTPRVPVNCSTIIEKKGKNKNGKIKTQRGTKCVYHSSRALGVSFVVVVKDLRFFWAGCWRPRPCPLQNPVVDGEEV